MPLLRPQHARVLGLFTAGALLAFGCGDTLNDDTQEPLGGGGGDPNFVTGGARGRDRTGGAAGSLPNSGGSAGGAETGGSPGSGGDGAAATGGRGSGGRTGSGGRSGGGGSGGRGSGGRGGSGGGSSGGSAGGSSGGGGGATGGSGGSSGGTSGTGAESSVGGSGGTGEPAQAVELVGEVTRAGVTCLLVRTTSADYYFDKAGAGFVSIVDTSGRDWVSWSTASSHRGEYRGVPNLGPCCHPGYVGARTTVLVSEPDRVVLRSVPESGSSWETRWEFRADHARLRVTKPPGSYYLLYEGTPGGSLGSEDFIGFADGRLVPLAEGAFLADLPSPEWVYFLDATLGRALLVLHPADDAIADTYWTFDTMTVFGFGRTCQGGCTGLTRANEELVIALTDDTAPEDLAALAERLTLTAP